MDATVCYYPVLSPVFNMVNTTGQKKLLRFGFFELDTRSGELRRQGVKVKLHEKSFQLLLALLEHPGEVVTREELRDRLWPSLASGEFDRYINIAMNKVRAALDDPADSPRFIETLRGRGYRFNAPVSTVLSDGEQGLQSAEETTKPSVGPQLGPDARRWFLRGLPIAIIIGAAIVYYLLSNRNGPANASPPVIPRPSVAVMGFKNLSTLPATAWVSTALSDLLGAELAAGEKLRTISPETIARVRKEISTADADRYSPETLSQLRSILGVDYVLVGSYVDLEEKTGGKIRLDARLQETKSAATLLSLSDQGTESDISDLVARAGAQLREKLSLGTVTAAESNEVRAAVAGNPEAAKLYFQGLAKLRQFEALAAREILQKATKADPNYPLAHLGLAAAWSALGYDPKATDEARTAFDLSANLS